MDCNCDYIFPDLDCKQPHYNNCNSVWKKNHPGRKLPKNEDGTIQLQNDNLKLKVDVLYHLGFDTASYDLVAMFQDVKFVCVGGTKHRMKMYAKYIGKVLKLNQKVGNNLIKDAHRFAMYKMGPVLLASHGIGIPSMITALQEIFKLLHYAKAKDPIIFRIGTSGGIGVPGGSVVISTWALDGNMEKSFNLPILGKSRKIPAILDERISEELHSLVTPFDEFSTHLGGTMGTDDFYRSQGRLDGPICDYTEAEKLDFLNELYNMGIRNMEMEAPAFSALTNEMGIRAGIVCVTYLNRLMGDQVTSSAETLDEWQERPMILVGRYIEKYFNRAQ